MISYNTDIWLDDQSQYWPLIGPGPGGDAAGQTAALLQLLVPLLSAEGGIGVEIFYTLHEICKVEVQSPPGTVIGTVEQEWSICDIKYDSTVRGIDQIICEMLN